MPHCSSPDKLENRLEKQTLGGSERRARGQVGVPRGRVIAEQHVIGAGPEQVTNLKRNRVGDDLGADLGYRMKDADEQNHRRAKYYHGEKDKHSKLRREQDADHKARGDKHPHDNRSFVRNAASLIHNECLNAGAAGEY